MTTFKFGLGFVLGLFFVAQPLFARSLSEIKKSGTLRVAFDGATPGFNYYKGKDLVGFEVDLAQAIANHLGLKIESKVQPFNTLLMAINQGAFDLIATGHSITPARAQVVDFTEAHYCTGAVIVSKTGGPKKASELVGKTVVLPVGTVYYDAVKKIAGVKEIRTVPKEMDGLQVLLSGRADAWVTENFLAMEALKVHSTAGVGIGESLQDQKNGMIVAKKNVELLDAVNGAFRKIFSDGTYLKLSKKYFDQDIRCKL